MLLALPEVVMSWFSYVWREDVIVLVGKRMAGCGRFRSAMVAILYKELVKDGRPLCRCCSKMVATAVLGKYIVTVSIQGNRNVGRVHAAPCLLEVKRVYKV